ncbi:MAG: ribosome-associated translation inhibitor RaiA [Flavobacteriales bacterium]|jgi:putative sigma-54 modulation protein|nr:ribosome-associated translation inhibitor RaiA [Flavobacteriales bacterium]
MKINVQPDGFTVDQKLVDFIQVKLDKLEKFYDKVVDANVYLKLESPNEKENKVVEIKMNVPGNEFVVKKQSKSFEESADMCSEALRRMLIKHKDKMSV